ncbi:hypothetical protein ScPMuIL_005996 [Solemya velum]
MNIEAFIPESIKRLPTHMDFEGQKKAEKTFQIIILLFGIVGFVWGYICQQFSQTMYILLAGCFVYGLYLEGAGWNREEACLIRQKPKQLIQDLPVLKIIPIESHRLKLQNTLRTPVYVTSQRRNAMGVGLVFEADLFTTEHTSHWVLQGVCLSLNTD